MAIKVLVIDDERLLAKSTCMALSFFGMEAYGALDGEEGLIRAEELLPNVILLDVMMPGIDGWQVLEQLSTREKTRQIPVIMFTAKEHPNGTKLAQSKGAVDYLAKPFEFDDMIEKIQKYATV